MTEKSAGQKLAEAMREKFPDAKIIKCKRNKKADKELRDFLHKMREAQKKTAGSKLHFGATA